jgi:nucleotide-binding universal stress UspA family protein
VDERIVAAVDGSRPSRAALDWALERARRQHGLVTLVNVVEDTLGGTAPNVEARLARQAINSLEAERARIERESPELNITTELAYGSILQTLKRISENCDLLVIGTHKNGILKGTLLGSLGIRIAAAAACPVAVIPAPAPSGVNVVVGIDDTPESQAAGDFAAQEADATGSELVMICAGYIANPLFADLVPPVLPGKERAKILGRASELIQRRFPAVSVQTRVVDGPPDEALLDASLDARVLVVGHHHRSTIVNLFGHSVAKDVLVGMAVPVIVVHDTTRRTDVVSSQPAAETKP